MSSLPIQAVAPTIFANSAGPGRIAPPGSDLVHPMIDPCGVDQSAALGSDLVHPEIDPCG